MTIAPSELYTKASVELQKEIDVELNKEDPQDSSAVAKLLDKKEKHENTKRDDRRGSCGNSGACCDESCS